MVPSARRSGERLVFTIAVEELERATRPSALKTWSRGNSLS